MSKQQQPLALTGPAGAGGTLADEQVVVDALPYLDTEYNETDRQMALQLIDHECKIFRPTKNYLKHLPVPDYDAFLSTTMIKEHARMAKKQEMPKLDMRRCELPCPAGTSRQGDKAAWQKAIKNAKAQNEHLAVRQLNLSLMDEYSGEQMLRRNKGLEETLKEEETQLRKCKEEVMETHARRKMAQMDAGRALKDLEGSWVSMVTKNYRMEMENNRLLDEIEVASKKLKLDQQALDQLMAN